jgi:glycosyltransferase involved in cell wall biosynthesis
MTSLSAVLPIYNEAAAIQETVEQVRRSLAAQVSDFEQILLNDGSTDATGAILAAFATDPRIRVVRHERNQGFGAALVDSFAAVSKTLTFFTNSDGQFDIADLSRLLQFIKIVGGGDSSASWLIGWSRPSVLRAAPCGGWFSRAPAHSTGKRRVTWSSPGSAAGRIPATAACSTRFAGFTARCETPGAGLATDSVGT